MLGRTNRRAFIAGLGSAAAWPSAVSAQQAGLPLVGFLSVGSPTLTTQQTRILAFVRGLAETGFVEGRNVVIEYRWADSHNDRLPGLAADLALLIHAK